VQAPSAYAAVQENSKFSGLRAPATSFIWTKRSPVSGDLLLYLAALSIPAKVSLQRDLQFVAVRFEQDRLDQRTNCCYGARSAFFALQGATEAPDRLAIDVRHPRVQELQYVRSIQTRLQFGFPGLKGHKLVLDRPSGDVVLDRLNELADLPFDSGELGAGAREARAMLHPQSIQLAHVLSAAVLEEVPAHQLVAKRDEDPFLHLLAADGQAVRAHPA
jgi:hypothetical protein